MKKIVLIVAGGSGTRMNSDIPKQFIEIAGIPLVMHTFNAFRNFDPQLEFLLILPETQVANWHQLCEKYNFDIIHKIAIGGKTRFHSVKNGLDTIEGEGVVLIHDAVRPFVSETTLKNCLYCAETAGNALPVIQATDSIRIVDGNQNYSANRSQIFLVQTPQTFQISVIKKAYQVAIGEDYTDDASVLESIGVSINLVEGNRENFKITTPADLIIAEAFLKKNDV